MKFKGPRPGTPRAGPDRRGPNPGHRARRPFPGVPGAVIPVSRHRGFLVDSRNAQRASSPSKGR